jgi:hypothetical protein
MEKRVVSKQKKSIIPSFKGEKVTFVRLKNLMELNQPKTGEEISLALGYLRGFRGKYVDQETAETLIT